MTDFNLAALYAALDAQRQVRGMTWDGVVREITARGGQAPSRAISRATVVGLRTKAIAEADGVLQMLRWLNRPPESFLPDFEATGLEFQLPDIPADQILRFDTRKLHAALDAVRVARRLTWQAIAHDVAGMSAASLTRLREGGRTSFPHVLRITR